LQQTQRQQPQTTMLLNQHKKKPIGHHKQIPYRQKHSARTVKIRANTPF